MVYFKLQNVLNLFLKDTRTDRRYLERRELCFTLKNEVYLRFQSFVDAAQLESEMIRLCPEKIDIGAVYSHRVCTTY